MTCCNWNFVTGENHKFADKKMGIIKILLTRGFPAAFPYYICAFWIRGKWGKFWYKISLSANPCEQQPTLDLKREHSRKDWENWKFSLFDFQFFSSHGEFSFIKNFPSVFFTTENVRRESKRKTISMKAWNENWKILISSPNLHLVALVIWTRILRRRINLV